MAEASSLLEMLRKLEPRLHEEKYCYTEVPIESDWAAMQPVASIREDDCMSLIVAVDVAKHRALPELLEVAWIALELHSELAAVGLTAAIATAFAQQSIPCNVVAGARHDHIFVPWKQRHQALSVLLALQAQQQSPV